MRPIPVSAASHIAKEYGYDQVIVIARRVRAPGGEHVTTYGIDAEHCNVAARVGNFIKRKIMNWPEYSTLHEHDMKRALEEMLAAHSMENVGVDASMRRLNAKKRAREVLKHADD